LTKIFKTMFIIKYKSGIENRNKFARDTTGKIREFKTESLAEKYAEKNYFYNPKIINKNN